MPTGFNIQEVVTELGQYFHTYERQIQRRMFQDIVTENYMQSVPNVQDKYVSVNSTIDSLVQPFQRAFTPRGTAKFEPFVNEVHHVKVDFLFENLDEIYQSYLGYLIDENTLPTEVPFVQYVVNELIMASIRQDIEMKMAFSGKYEAPTANTPSSPDKAANGVGTIIDNAVNAGDLTPIPTGAIDKTNALDRFESFVDAIPVLYRNLPGNIYASPTLARYYMRAYRNEFGGQNDPAAKNNLNIDATNKQIVGLPSMEGSNMIFFTPERNMIKMFNKVYIPNSFEVQRHNRTIKMLTDWFRGYGFRTLEVVFVNDQPSVPA